MTSDLIQYGVKGSHFDENLEVLRQYEGIVSLSNSAVSKTVVKDKDPLSLHRHLYDLPIEIKVELEEIEGIMNRIPCYSKSTVYDRIEELGKLWRATRNRKTIDDALSQSKRIAQTYSPSLTPDCNRTDLSTRNNIGSHQDSHGSPQPSSTMPDPKPDNSVVEFNSTHSAPISYENYSGDYMNGGKSYHNESQHLQRIVVVQTLVTVMNFLYLPLSYLMRALPNTLPSEMIW